MQTCLRKKLLAGVVPNLSKRICLAGSIPSGLNFLMVAFKAYLRLLHPRYVKMVREGFQAPPLSARQSLMLVCLPGFKPWPMPLQQWTTCLNASANSWKSSYCKGSVVVEETRAEVLMEVAILNVPINLCA